MITSEKIIRSLIDLPPPLDTLHELLDDVLLRAGVFHNLPVGSLHGSGLTLLGNLGSQSECRRLLAGDFGESCARLRRTLARSGNSPTIAWCPEGRDHGATLFGDYGWRAATHRKAMREAGMWLVERPATSTGRIRTLLRLSDGDGPAGGSHCIKRTLVQAAALRYHHWSVHELLAFSVPSTPPKRRGRRPR